MDFETSIPTKTAAVVYIAPPVWGSRPGPALPDAGFCSPGQLFGLAASGWATPWTVFATLGGSGCRPPQFSCKILLIGRYKAARTIAAGAPPIHMAKSSKGRFHQDVL